MAINFGKQFLYKRKHFSNPRKLNNIPTYLFLAKFSKINPKLHENGWNWEVALNFVKQFSIDENIFSYPLN